MRVSLSLLSFLPIIPSVFALPPLELPNALALNSSFYLNDSAASIPDPTPPLPPVNYPEASCLYYQPRYGGNIANDKDACRHALVTMLEEGRDRGGVRTVNTWVGASAEDKRVWVGTAPRDPNRKCWVRLHATGPPGRVARGRFSYDDMYIAADFVMKECMGTFDRVKGRQYGGMRVPRQQAFSDFMVILSNQQNTRPRVF